MQDIFFDTSVLDLDAKRRLCIRAKELSKSWTVDILDCSKSWCREAIEMPFDQIMAKLTAGCHFTVIHRTHNIEGEVGFRAMTKIDYFLWIFLTVENLYLLVKEFSLPKYR